MVQPFEMGVIRTIDIAVGTRVNRNQVLLTLDSTAAESSASDLAYRTSLLSAEVARLSAEADGQPMESREDNSAYQVQRRLAEQRQLEYAACLGDYAANIQRLSEKRVAASELQNIILSRLEIAKELEATRQHLLAKQASSRTSVLQARSDRLTLEEQLSASSAEATDYARQIDKVQAELKAFSQNWKREILDRLV